MSAWLGRMPWALLWLFFAVSVRAAPPEDQFREWVRQLNADDFVTREAASQNLIAAGDLAIEALAEGLASGNPEVVWRSRNALKQVALNRSDEALSRVVESLSKVSRPGKPGVESIVRELSIRRAEFRRKRAAATIRSFGGRFKADISEVAVVWNGVPQLAVIDADVAPPNPVIEPPAEARVLDPPPELLPDQKPVAPGAVLIADAFVAPGMEEVDVTDEASESLTLDHSWRGGDLGLADLRDLPEIVALSLHRAPLTDAALGHIASLPRLRSLNIEQTPFTSAAVRKFRERQPLVEVSFREAATNR